MLNEVLNEIKPSEKEQKSVKATTRSFMQKLITNLKQHKVEVQLGGSIAKDTFLKNNHDADVFVRFDYKKYYSKDISEILAEAVASMETERIHGSRDYFKVQHKGIIFEIVPVLKVDKAEKAVNVTDMSPLHVSWVKRKVKNKPQLKDEVRLAKQFCKANRVYGAESYIGGFSGHVLDILIIYYGSFKNFLKASLEWKEKQVIDPEKHGKKLNISKITPLIVIDPIDPTRNAAAALSKEMIRRFQGAAKKFLEKPAKKFFRIEKITKDKILKKYPNAVIVEAKGVEGRDEAVGGKLLKVKQHIEKNLNEFEVEKADWCWQETALMWFVTKKQRVPRYFERQGPPLKKKENARKFKKMHPDYYVKGDFLFAKIRREHTTVSSKVKSLINDEYVKERVSEIWKS